MVLLLELNDLGVQLLQVDDVNLYPKLVNLLASFLYILVELFNECHLFITLCIELLAVVCLQPSKDINDRPSPLM